MKQSTNLFCISVLFFFLYPHLSAQEVWILIHGTFGSQGAWYQKDGEFYESLKKGAYNKGKLKKICAYTWSGRLKPAERFNAALDFLDFLTNNTVPTDTINIIAHSHGGNVAIMASQLFKKYNMQHKINSLYCLATPVNNKIFYPDMDVIKTVYNFFSYGDFVQPVMGLFSRAYTDHERIWNILFVHRNTYPNHQDMHPKELAWLLPALPELIVEQSRDILFTLEDDGSFFITTDHNRKRSLAQDKLVQKRIISNYYFKNYF